MSATAPADPRPARRFVPDGVDVAAFGQIEPLFRSLLDRPIGSTEELAQWLADASELTAVIDEFGNRRYIAKSCHTDDQQAEQAYLHFVEQIETRVKPLLFALQRKFLDCPHRSELSGPRHAMLERRWRAEVELFRDENVPLETQVIKLASEYDKLCGAMVVSFRGLEYTLQQLGRFGEEPDRPTREEAWRLHAQRRLQDREAIETIFERQLALREPIARNAGLPDYRAWCWKAYKRFDYTPDDCIALANAIERTCVPLVRRLNRQRRSDLGLDTLRPWDLAVDPQGRPPLRPFTQEQVPEFVEKTRQVFGRLSPQLAEQFDSLRANNNLDLASRKGKQPGGYQCSLEEVRQPFIFMNAVGLQRDVEVLLHEGGHAFHCLAAASEPLVFLRSAPMEFCEVASMSMELLGSEHLDVFYPDAAHAARARRMLLEGILQFFPWMATIDLFQHWIYTHPGHTRQQRTDHWLGLLERFGADVDWSGLAEPRSALWQRQLHLFHQPFYYIEYGIAQLGAWQLWLKAMEDPRRALANYRSALSLGGTRALPELFRAAGIRFDFSAQTLGPLLAAVGEQLEALPR
jgi:oligoendopeptidase F